MNFLLALIFTILTALLLGMLFTTFFMLFCLMIGIDEKETKIYKMIRRTAKKILIGDK